MKKEDYDKIREKYPELPTFDELDWEWEISDIDQKQYLLRHIRRRIVEKLERTAQILQAIIQPDPNSFVDLYECRMFSEEDKKDVFEICRKLMHHHRKFMEAAMKRDDKEEAETIAEAYQLWKENKAEVIRYVTKLKDCWQKEIKTKDVLYYLG